MARGARLGQPSALPDKLGASIDLLARTRARRRGLEEQALALRDEERRVEEHLLASFRRQEVDGARGRLGSVRLAEKDVPRVTDWDALHRHVAKTGEWDLIQKRAGEAACQARWEDKKEVPGVEKFHRVDVVLTTSKGE